jgi:hypothetical protein
MWGKKSEGYLLSKLEVKSKLLTSASNMQRKLSAYPNLRQVRHGTVLGYVIEEEPGSHFYSIELDKARASIAIYSKTTPLYFLDEAIMRFLSIMQIVSKDYEIALSDLYPYLAIALSWQRMKDMFKDEPPAERSENTDIILSKRIIGLAKENRQLNELYNMMLNKNRRLLHRLIILESTNSQSIEAIAKIAEVRRDEVESALRDIRESGYKAVRLSPDRFSLVRI